MFWAQLLLVTSSLLLFGTYRLSSGYLTPDELLYTDFRGTFQKYAGQTDLTALRILFTSFVMSAIREVNQYAILAVNWFLTAAILAWLWSRSAALTIRYRNWLFVLFLLPSFVLYSASFLRDIYIFFLVVGFFVHMHLQGGRVGVVGLSILAAIVMLRWQLGVGVIGCLVAAKYLSAINLKILVAAALVVASVVVSSSSFLTVYVPFVEAFEGTEKFAGSFFLFGLDPDWFFVKSLGNWVFFYFPMILEPLNSVTNIYLWVGAFPRIVLVSAAVVVFIAKKTYSTTDRVAVLMILFSYLYSLPIYDAYSANRFSFVFLPAAAYLAQHLRVYRREDGFRNNSGV